MPVQGVGTFARWIIILFITASLGACASTGAPLPKEEIRPPVIVDSLAVVQGSEVSIRLRVPKARKAKNQPERIRTLKLVWQGDDEDRSKATIQEIPSIPAPQAGLTVQFTDTVTPGNWVRYEVFNQSKDKVVSARYDIGRAKVEAPAASPQNLRVEAGDGFARLRWDAGAMEAPKQEGGQSLPLPVVIYRLGEETQTGTTSQFPITETPLQATSFEDWGLELKTKVRYRVCHARLDKGLILQGGCATEVEISVDDATPPPEPQITLLTPVREKGVLVRWEAVTDPGVLGYRVERKTGPKGKYSAISDFITVLETTDRTMDQGEHTYYYRVVALDRGGHESRSAEQSILWPPKTPEPVETPAPKDETNAATAPAAKDDSKAASPEKATAKPAASPTQP